MSEPKSTGRVRVIAALSFSNYKTSELIAELSGVSVSRVRVILNKLWHAGLVKRIHNYHRMGSIGAPWMWARVRKGDE